ncbi:phage tail tape measure C-terminal domain-containing protein [Sphingomonas nostoxanthinifaciens]|uniref:phage tail tape measure C-terminal domain-containing protein n=1 Tax=Sphingomonas nostoxanthinifaciens TaxID=2872652 RepID=UPI001CC20136|nr:phage tail tape measure C-terminal domain-containing protein [Sphingomonas nostoxanthinifaciens]UAK23675.1 hypothetical protein K8P63_14985 [Sphingomonas nostoxanthinifaciens]
MVAAGTAGTKAGEVITTAHNRMSASSLILQHVLRSSADSYSAGLPIATIFGEQISRLGEAAAFAGQEAGNSTSAFAKFGAFMGGPGGLAVSAFVAVLAPLAIKLLESDDAAKMLAEDIGKAATAADTFGAAQSELGKIIDLTTGRLKTHNEVLIQTIRLQAQANQLAAEAAEKEDAKTLKGKGEQTFTERASGILSLFTPSDAPDLAGVQLGRASVASQEASLAPLQKVIDEFQVKLAAVSPDTSNKAFDKQIGAVVDGAKAAIDQLAKAGQLGGRDPIEIKKALLAQATDRSTQYAQGLVVDGIDGKGVADDLKPYQKPKKSKVDRTAERAAEEDKSFTDQQRGENDAYSKALQQLTQSAQQWYDIALGQIQTDLSAKSQSIDDQVRAKKLTQAHADQLKAQLLENAGIQEEVEQRKLQIALYDAAYQADKQARDNQIALLQIDLQFATTRKDRLAIEQQLLAQQQKQRLADLDRTIEKSNDPSEIANAKAEKSLLPQQFARQRDATNLANASPIDAYKRQLSEAVGSSDALNDSLQKVAVDGFKGIEDGFVGVITGTKSVASAFKDMATSILADLAKIAIEKLLVNTIGGGFFGLKDGGPVLKRAGGGPVFGAGGPRDDKIPALLSNGEFIINAAATAKHRALLTAINDNRMPHFADGGMVGSASLRLPSLSGITSAQRPIVNNIYDLSNSFVDQNLWDRIGGISAGQVSAAAPQIAAAGGRIGQQRVVQKAARRMR